MKHNFPLYLFLLSFLNASGQAYPEFSPLSGSTYHTFSTTKANGSLFYCLRKVVDSVALYTTYKLNEEGQITDSVSHSADGVDRWGWITEQEGRIFFHGIRWIGSVYTNSKHTVLEYDQQLQLVGETIGASITPGAGFIGVQSTGFITMTQMSDFHLYNDTLLAAYQFLMVDSPFVFQGRRNIFLKMGLDGSVYAQKDLPVNEMYNVFFGNGKMYVQGSTDVAPFVPRALSEWDSNGDLVRGTDYDNWGSGEYLEGSLGLWRNGRFYLTYVGKNDNLPGCVEDNAAIDVRDSSWAVLHRFKLPDCGYWVSGKTPFAFDAQDNVYYAAPSKVSKKIMVYKFTPDFQLIWNTELDFTGQSGSILPASLVTTDDSGVVVNCLNSSSASLRIFKISAAGDVISSTSLPLANPDTQPVVYPSPTVGPLQVLPGYSAAAVAQVTSLDGRPVGVFDLSAQSIDLSAYPAGIYAVSVWDADLRRLLGKSLVLKQ